MLRDDVSVLYVDPRGPYPKLVADWWGEARDARNYNGPNPVVAHPPCGPWGKLRSLCTCQDEALGPLAVSQVRKYGGVLEHPETSTLFSHCGCWNDGIGKLWYLEQGAFGHVAQKRTVIYTVGVPSKAIWNKRFAPVTQGARSKT